MLGKEREKDIEYQSFTVIKANGPHCPFWVSTGGLSYSWTEIPDVLGTGFTEAKLLIGSSNMTERIKGFLVEWDKSNSFTYTPSGSGAGITLCAMHEPMTYMLSLIPI